MRSGFTLIELIFVIVVLGILASVAVPKLTGIQDDALVASEKSGIDSIRSAIASLHGRMMMTSAAFTVSTTKANGEDYNLTFRSSDHSSTHYPKYLSVGGTDGLSTSSGNVDSADSNGTDGTLVAVIDDPAQRTQWATAMSGTKITGPATRSIAKDSGTALTVADWWIYSSTTGAIVLKDN